MQNDDELVEMVAQSMFAALTSQEKIYFHEVQNTFRKYARAAIAVMREAGWTPPIFSHALTMGSAAYKVKLGPSGNLVYEPVDLYETEKPDMHSVLRPNYRRARALALEIEAARVHLDEARGDPSYTLDDIEDLKGELHHLEHEFFKTGVSSEYDL